MDPNKNIKDVKANLQFLKKFEGKKTLITKNGLIQALQSQPESPQKNRNNVSRQNIPSANSPQLKTRKQQFHVISTQPSLSTELPQKNLNWMNTPFSIKPFSRGQHNSMQSNRSQKASRVIQSDLMMDSNLARSDIHPLKNLKGNKDKLPKLVRANSLNKIEKYANIIDYAVTNKRGSKYSRMQTNINNDRNAINYLEQLQKFQANLRGLKAKTSSSKYIRGTAV